LLKIIIDTPVARICRSTCPFACIQLVSLKTTSTSAWYKSDTAKLKTYGKSVKVRHPRARGDPGFENTCQINTGLDARFNGHDDGGTFAGHP